MIGYKIQSFQGVQKTEYMLSRYIDTARMKIFQSNIFIFDCAMPNKAGKDNGVAFLKRIFLHF